MELPSKKEAGSALDSIEHELYNPNKKMDDMTMHQVHDTKTRDLPTSWGESTSIIKEINKEKGMSFGFKILIASFLLLLVSLSFTAWRVLSSRNIVSASNIDMTLDIVSSIEGGEETPLVVSIHNRNGVDLEETTLTLSYKQGVGTQDEQEKIQEKYVLGTISANGYKRQDFKVVLYGSEAESRDITVKLEYKIAGSKAVFPKVQTTAVVLKTSPISIRIEGPSTLSIGQLGKYIFSLKNNTGTTSLSNLFQLTLPTAFIVDTTDPKPNSRGQIWVVPPLMPGETKTITVVGSLSGTQGEVATMKAVVGGQGGSVSSIGVIYSSQIFDVRLRSSPLTFNIMLDTERGVADSLRYGDKTTIAVMYTNNSDKPLHDVSINLGITGDAPIIKQINPDNGYYDSQSQVIIWNKANVSGLAILAPKAEGTFRVAIPIVSKGSNSPALKLSLSGIGTIEEKDDVVATFSKSWIVQGSANISAKTNYKNSPFQNSGPIPPQVNVDTTYTAHITVSAQNSLVNTKVSFILPIYVTWRNVISEGLNISYDQKTRTVSWLINNLQAEKTVVADIGLSARPSQSQVGQSPAITSGIVLEADEEVSKAHIRTTISALTTFISGESWNTDPSRVVDR